MSSCENDIMYFLSKYSCLHTNKYKLASSHALRACGEAFFF